MRYIGLSYKLETPQLFFLKLSDPVRKLYIYVSLPLLAPTVPNTQPPHNTHPLAQQPT
jgi:hypothetical protein